MPKTMKADEPVDFTHNGGGVDAAAEARVLESTSELFTREKFEAMQQDTDLNPSLAEEDGDEEGYIPLAKPGQSYFTVHPAPREGEFSCVVAFDFRKTEAKSSPYLVLPAMWPHFPPALLRVKRLLLCLSWKDETAKPFLWMADWCEGTEAPNELHRSISRVVVHGREGWIQALFDKRGFYTWRRWPESRLGVPPVPFWPERSLFEIVRDTFSERVIATADHPLIQAIGEE